MARSRTQSRPQEWTIGGYGGGPVTIYNPYAWRLPSSDELRIGIIGLDTSHSVDFTEIINGPEATDEALDVLR